MVEDALGSNMQESDLCVAPRLLSIIMQRCRGRINTYIPLYLHLVLPKYVLPLSTFDAPADCITSSMVISVLCCVSYY